MYSSQASISGGGNVLSSALIQSAGKTDLAPQRVTEAKRLIKDNALRLNTRGEVVNFNEWLSSIHAAAQVLEAQVFLSDRDSSIMLTTSDEIDAAVEFISHRNMITALEKQVGSTQVSAILNGKTMGTNTRATTNVTSTPGHRQSVLNSNAPVWEPLKFESSDANARGGPRNSESEVKGLTPDTPGTEGDGEGHENDDDLPMTALNVSQQTSQGTRTGPVSSSVNMSGAVSSQPTSTASAGLNQQATNTPSIYQKFLSIVKRNASCQSISGGSMHGRKVVYFLDASFRIPEDSCTELEIAEFEEALGSKFFLRDYGVAMGYILPRFYMPLESKFRASHRQALFSILEESISKAVTRAETKNIAHNDCYNLYVYVVERFGIDRKEERYNAYYDSFLNLTKIDTTSFDLWHSQHQAFIKEGQELNGSLPEFFLRTHIRLAVYKSNNKNLKLAWTETSRRFRAMEREFDKNTGRYDSEDISLESFFLSLRDDYQTRGYYVAPSQQPTKGGETTPKQDKRVNSVGKQKPPCLNFNDGGCTRGDCKFDHRKLNKDEIDKLKDRVDKARAKKQTAKVNRVDASKAEEKKDD